MIYFLFYSLFLTYIYFFNKINAKYSFFIFLLLPIIWIIPALQFNIGTDYSNYIDIIKYKSYDYYQSKGELSFFYITRYLSQNNFNPQYLFVVISFIQSFLLLNIIRILKVNKYNVFIVALLIITVSNVLHNQMNVLRAFVAVYCFINSYLYMKNDKILKGLFFLIFGITWHFSIIITIPLFLINKKNIEYLFNRLTCVYIITFILFLIGFPLSFLKLNIISDIFPMYVHYMSSDFVENKLSVFNVLSKLIYVPIYILFFMKYKKYSFCYLEKTLLVVWALTTNLYFLSFYNYFIIRFVYFFVLFNIFPIYYVISSKFNYNSILRVGVGSFIVSIYLMKILFFPVGEFLFSSVLFN